MYKKILSFLFIQIFTLSFYNISNAEEEINKSSLEETILDSKEIDLWNKIIKEIVLDDELTTQLPIIKNTEEWIIYLNNLNYWDLTTKEFVLNAIKLNFKNFNLNKIIHNNISSTRIKDLLNINLPQDTHTTEIVTLKKYLFTRVLELTKKDIENSKNLNKNKTLKFKDVEKKAVQKNNASNIKKKIFIAIILFAVLFLIFYAKKFFE